MSNRTAMAVLTLALALGIAGCRNLRDAHLVDPLVKETGYNDSTGKPLPIELETYCFPEDGPPTGCAVAQVDTIDPDEASEADEESAEGTGSVENTEADEESAEGTGSVEKTKAEVKPLAAYAKVANADDADKVELRNRLQVLLMERSDRICEAHKGAIVADAAAVNFALGTATTLFSTTAAVVGGELAKSILAGVAAASSAEQNLINQEVFRERFATSIVKSIDENRKAVADAIADHRDDTYAAYTIDDAIRDVGIYHFRCSFYQGLKFLEEAVSRSGLNRDELLSRAARLREEIASNTPADPMTDTTAMINARKLLAVQLEQVYRQLGTTSFEGE